MPKILDGEAYKVKTTLSPSNNIDNGIILNNPGYPK